MSEANEPANDCPLSVADQTRNMLIVGVNTALSYLASPVLYVGVVHAPLCKRLQTSAGVEPSATLANLPASGYTVASVLPVFVAWAFPQVRLLRSVVVLCYAALALVAALVVAVLLAPLPWEVKVTAVILHGLVVGGARMVAVAGEFEVLGVAVSEKRRGQALGLAYGAGPLLAIVGALASQLMLAGRVGPFVTGRFGFPGNFALVFAASVPVMALGAFLSSRLVIPLPKIEAEREPFWSGIFGSFGSFLGRRVIVMAVVTCTMIFWGYQVISNLALYQDELMAAGGGQRDEHVVAQAGGPAEEEPEMAGYQNAVRFACKSMMGLCMGWVLTWAAARTACLITATAGLTAVVFALVAPPQWFLLCFGILGMGELYGIYITNYILCSAAPSQIRRYMACTMLTGLAVAPAGAFYGALTDYYGAVHGRLDGFRASFAAACGLILFGILLTLFMSPRPQRPEEKVVV